MNITLITSFVAAIVAAAAAWAFQDARYTAELAEQALTHKTAELDAVSRVRSDERAITKTYQEALNAARIRENTLRRDVAAAGAQSDGLREQAAEAARRLAAAPPAAVLEYATALGVVFQDCRAAYAELVPKADGHSSDVRTHREAWPVIPPRPDAGITPLRTP